MLVGSGLGAPEWLTTIGTQLTQVGTAAAKAAGGAAAGYVGGKLVDAGAAANPPPMPAKSEGIPQGAVIALSVVGVAGLIALLSRKKRSRPTVTNPGRRRRRRRR